MPYNDPMQPVYGLDTRVDEAEPQYQGTPGFEGMLRSGGEALGGGAPVPYGQEEKAQMLETMRQRRLSREERDLKEALEQFNDRSLGMPALGMKVPGNMLSAAETKGVGREFLTNPNTIGYDYEDPERFMETINDLRARRERVQRMYENRDRRASR